MEPHGDQRVLEAGARLGQGRSVVILAHGRHAGPENILDLVPRLARPALTYLAPAAAGRSWYPLSFLAPIADNEPGFSSGLAVLASLVARAESAGVPRSRVVLMGFSQGACLTASFALAHAAPLGGVVVFSGGLVGPPGTSWPDAGAFDGTPVFFGCSDRDSHVPADRVRESAEVFKRHGAAVDLRLYQAIGHLVNDEEIDAARAILDAASA
jgi:phospholipase/carboxylesterase/glyoxalase family protein